MVNKPAVATRRSSRNIANAGMAGLSSSNANANNSNNTNEPLSIESEILNRAAVKLPYSLHGSSGWTGQYLPENILVNNPNDQGSRWSSSSTSQAHYLTLKLDEISVLRK